MCMSVCVCVMSVCNEYECVCVMSVCECTMSVCGVYEPNDNPKF